MSRVVATVLTLMFASAAMAQAPQSEKPVRPTIPWAVSVVHSIDPQKMVELMREEKLRVGIAGSAPQYMYNITTGLVVDDQGHVVTRLAYLDLQEKNHKLAVTTADGTTVEAKLIGIDFATGFAVLDVASLKGAFPAVDVTTSPVNGSSVRILSSDVAPRVVSDKFFLSPSITVSQGHVFESIYSKARGAFTLLSDNLLARCDSSVVMTLDSKVLGMAQYAGFGRAYLYPIKLIRDTIARRVIEKKDNVAAGGLGFLGYGAAQLSDADALRMGLEHKAGVVVREVTRESPAARAGLLPSDVIVGFDDFEIGGLADLKAILAPLPAGRAIRLRALRNRQPLEIKAVLGPRALTESDSILTAMDQTLEPALSEREQLNKRLAELGDRYRSYFKHPPSKESNEAIRELAIEIRQIQERLRMLGPDSTVPAPQPAAASSQEYVGADFTAERTPRDVSFPAGFTARDITPQVAALLHAPSGVLISSVDRDSLAERGGMKAGDVVVGTQDVTVHSVTELHSLLSTQHGSLKLKLVRDKKELALSLSLP
jgi:S1-C subfamily serine protease